MRVRATAFLLLAANLAVYLRHPILVAKYLKRFPRLPNICVPRTQPERMLWRKIFDRNPLYRLMLDKLAVREFVRARCPDLPLSDVVWIGTEAERIPEAVIGEGFVIKANNGSDRNLFPEAATTRPAVVAQLRTWLREPYGVWRGEWGYGRIQPAVYAERRVVPPPGSDLIELNCQVAMGRCFLVSAMLDVKKPTVRRALFDREGNRLPFRGMGPVRGRQAADLPLDFVLPAAFATVVRRAEALGRDCDYVRVDFICYGDRFSFGEFTVYHSSGYQAFDEPVERMFAANWDLRNTWFMRQRWYGPRGWYAALLRAHLASVDERPSAPIRASSAGTAAR